MRTSHENEPRRAGAAAVWALTSVLALAGLAAGCEGQVGDEPVGESAEMSAEELGRLGGRIHAEPERADELLAEAGLTEEELDAQVRAVTADPDASREYAEAFREVAGEEVDEDVDEAD
jgi:hypothetical protein